MTSSNTIIRRAKGPHVKDNVPFSEKMELKTKYSAHDAPSVKEFLVVLLAYGLLIALSWIAYYTVGWFH